MTRLRSRTAPSGSAAMRRATASASAKTASSGTTFQAMPRAAAVLASKRSPNKISSLALGRPTSLGSSVVTAPVTKTPS